MGMLREMGQGSCAVQGPRDHLTQPGEKSINILLTVEVTPAKRGQRPILRLPSTFRECPKHKPQSHAPWFLFAHCLFSSKSRKLMLSPFYPPPHPHPQARTTQVGARVQAQLTQGQSIQKDG